MKNVSDKNTRVLFTISKELKSKLEKIAKEQDRSLSNLIVSVLKNYVSTLK